MQGVIQDVSVESDNVSMKILSAWLIELVIVI